MGVYIGLSEESKEISGIYLGAEESVKEVSEGYISDADGNLKEIYTGDPDPGQQVFTSSGTFTVPKGVKSVDVFLVGGGGAGGAGRYTDSGVTTYTYYNGSGGGGGYTTTVRQLQVAPGNDISVIVGDGSAISSGSTENDLQYGGSSKVLYNDESFEAVGGISGNYNEWNDGRGSGGSGGGSRGYTYQMVNRNPYVYVSGGAGGSDGSNGYYYKVRYGYEECNYSKRQVGQGTTTRAFGESEGTLYAGGGGGGSASSSWLYMYGGDGFTEFNEWESKQGYPENYGGAGGGGRGGIGYSSSSPGYSGTSNTGGGGGGSCPYLTDVTRVAKGGSGCVIIRWGY